jgi:hypothetical protein
MAGRKIHDERDALDCLERFEHSGLTFREWVKRQGVDGRSLQCWRMSLAKRRRSVRLVEVVTEVEVTMPARYLVRTGPFEVEVGDDFDGGTLARLLEVVAAC